MGKKSFESIEEMKYSREYKLGFPTVKTSDELNEKKMSPEFKQPLNDPDTVTYLIL